MGETQDFINTSKEPSKKNLLGSRNIFMKGLSDDFADVDIREELCYAKPTEKAKLRKERKKTRGGKIAAIASGAARCRKPPRFRHPSLYSETVRGFEPFCRIFLLIFRRFVCCDVCPYPAERGAACIYTGTRHNPTPEVHRMQTSL